MPVPDIKQVFLTYSSPRGTYVKGSYFVTDRTFDLLDALAESEYPMGTASLCKRARLSKSTVHRLLMVLETRKLVEREGESHGYRLGSKVAELARRSGPAESADGTQILLEELVQKTGGTARVGVASMYEQISLVLNSAGVVHSAARADVRMPIHCTALGKANVAFEPLFVGELLPYYDWYRIRAAPLLRLLSSGQNCAEYRLVDLPTTTRSTGRGSGVSPLRFEMRKAE